MPITHAPGGAGRDEGKGLRRPLCYQVLLPPVLRFGHGSLHIPDIPSGLGALPEPAVGPPGPRAPRAFQRTRAVARRAGHGDRAPFYPFARGLEMGQATGFLIPLAGYFILRPQKSLSQVGLALGFLLKPVPLLLPVLFFTEKKWRGLLVFTGTWLMASLAAIIILGRETFVQYLSFVLERTNLLYVGADMQSALAVFLQVVRGDIRTRGNEHRAGGCFSMVERHILGMGYARAHARGLARLPSAPGLPPRCPVRVRPLFRPRACSPGFFSPLPVPGPWLTYWQGQAFFSLRFRGPITPEALFCGFCA